MDGSRHAVVIVGGGTAGCATAIALAARGVEDVVVVDSERAPGWRIGEAVPPACRDVLNRLGVWDDFLAQGHLPSAGSCASWGKDELGYNDFLLAGQGKGFHLDRAAFDAMLMSVAARRGRARRGLRLRAAERRDDGHVLTLETENGARTCVTAGFLVDATGIAASAVRRLGVARNQVDCLAVVAMVFDLGEPGVIPSQALLEACEYGWWYAAKLPRDRMIVALAVEPARQRDFGAAERLHDGAAPDPCMRAAGSSAAARPAACEPVPALAPSAILSRVVGARWLAVGDAASAYDPSSRKGSSRRCATARPPPMQSPSSSPARAKRRCSGIRTESSPASPTICGCASTSTGSNGAGRRHRSGKTGCCR